METLFDGKPLREYAVIRLHTRAHTTMELADYGEYARRDTETLKDGPQKVRSTE